MITSTLFTGARFLVKAGVMGAAALALPGAAFAATYAYVNTTGDVATVIADDPMTAINIAPAIAVHSGVMLLTSPSDDIVGDDVSGI
jgi:hypothetical protein